MLRACVCMQQISKRHSQIFINTLVCTIVPVNVWSTCKPEQGFSLVVCSVRVVSLLQNYNQGLLVVNSQLIKCIRHGIQLLPSPLKNLHQTVISCLFTLGSKLSSECTWPMVRWWEVKAEQDILECSSFWGHGGVLYAESRTLTCLKSLMR